MRISESYVYFAGATDAVFEVLSGSQSGQIFEVSRSFYRYTANPTDDTVSIDSPTTELSRFFDDTQVILFTTDTMPGGLNGQGLTTYHVVNANDAGTTFQLSLSQGGSAVDITSSGVGRQLMVRV